MPIVEKTVFISYRRANYWAALAIYQHLTAQGYDVFFDYKNIKSGDFERVISENIQYRAHFLIVLTPSALERCDQPNDWLRKEIEMAIDEERNIVPLIYEGFDFGSPAVQEKLVGKLAQLSKYNGLPIYAAYFDEGMKRLAEEFLCMPLDAVLRPLSQEMRAITSAQQAAAAEAPKVTREELTAQEWFERGFKAADLQEKIRFYTEAVRLDPDYAYAYNNRGTRYADLDQHERAIQDFDKAIEINPEFSIAYYNRGTSYAVLVQHERAIQDYDKAIEINPGDPDYYSNRGNRYAALGQQERAIQDYDKAIEINSEYATAYANRGISYANLDQYERAIQDYDKAIEINPEYARAYYARGVSYSDLGQQELAIQDYDKAVEINPEDPSYYSNRGTSYAALDQHERAIQDYDKAVEITPEYARACYNRGVSYAALGQHERALQDYDKAIGINPEYINAYYNRGGSYAALDQHERAIQDYEKYLELGGGMRDGDQAEVEQKIHNLREKLVK